MYRVIYHNIYALLKSRLTEQRGIKRCTVERIGTMKSP